jgi:hypothetical protein
LSRRDEVAIAIAAHDLPPAMGLQRVVVGTEPPQVRELGLSAVLERNDVVDLEEPVVGAMS